MHIPKIAFSIWARFSILRVAGDCDMKVLVNSFPLIDCASQGLERASQLVASLIHLVELEADIFGETLVRFLDLIVL